ncbi:MAG TPA: D-2-hydroxyacid dehydrogenase [Anaerolineales bacterium]|nr:D-2-hydroxyacid dehydrogenase [Anaerolineales bacterium]
MPKLMIFSPEADEYRQRIESAHLPELELTTEPTVCDIALGEPKPIRDALPRLPRLRWIQSVYAGVEPLVDPTQRRDYILTNARDVFGSFMSEYVFGYILFHEKKILERMHAQQARQWHPAESGILPGKRLGVLGVGSIGAHLASTAKHFKMTVRGFTRESETSTQVDKYYHGEDLLAFAEGLDYLVSVLPRTRDTNRIVNAEVLNALASQAIFINVGRGNAVDESALIEALQKGRLAAAVLDVFDREPLPEDHPFWTTPNLYMTFHTSAISYPEDIVRLFAENYRLYLEGKPLKYTVDFEKGY